MLATAACGSDSDAETVQNAAGAASPAVNGARQEVSRLEQGPTRIPAKTRLPRRPEPGQPFINFRCQVPQCAVIADAMKRALSIVGWSEENARTLSGRDVRFLLEAWLDLEGLAVTVCSQAAAAAAPARAAIL